MPQISKSIPIKGHNSYPSVLKPREYFNFLGNMYVVHQSLSLATMVADKFYFYHATQPYELSFEIMCTGKYGVVFEECDSVTGSPISDVLLCTNRYTPGGFDVTFGDVTSWSTNIVSFVDVYLSANYLYSFGRQEITFVCAPAKYYVIELTNTSPTTEKQNMIFYIGDFLGS